MDNLIVFYAQLFNESSSMRNKHLVNTAAKLQLKNSTQSHILWHAHTNQQ